MISCSTLHLGPSFGMWRCKCCDHWWQPLLRIDLARSQETGLVTRCHEPDTGMLACLVAALPAAVASRVFEIIATHNFQRKLYESCMKLYEFAKVGNWYDKLSGLPAGSWLVMLLMWLRAFVEVAWIHLMTLPAGAVTDWDSKQEHCQGCTCCYFLWLVPLWPCTDWTDKACNLAQ